MKLVPLANSKLFPRILIKNYFSRGVRERCMKNPAQIIEQDQNQNCIKTYYSGGNNTASITCTTPLEASMVAIILAPFTVTSPFSRILISTLSPFAMYI